MTRGRDAFTLLEILVVLAILGMGLALVASIMRNAARYSERIEEETKVQLACDVMMNSILSGASVAPLGIETPIPDAPKWFVKVELLDGPIEKVVAVRITAQKYETFGTVSTTDSPISTYGRTPEPGRRIVVKEFARRADVRTRAIVVDANGRSKAIDGTGETYAQDLRDAAESGARSGGGLGGDSASLGGEQFEPRSEDSPFAELDAIVSPQNANPYSASANARQDRSALNMPAQPSDDVQTIGGAPQ